MEWCIVFILAATRLIYVTGNGDDFYRGTDWFKDMGWCSHSSSISLTGDFNGDGRADLLCHDSKGDKWVALANSDGQFEFIWYNAMGWCGHQNASVHLGDFNGDGRTDMLCHDLDGNKWVALANDDGTFTDNSWYDEMKWCIHKKAHLGIGDFNGDGRDDMFCYDNENMWISLAQPGGCFSGTSWHIASGWCVHEGSSIYIADFNGDRRDDLLCHDYVGTNWVMLARPDGTFSGRSSWRGSQKWCTAELHLGYLNGDKLADMLCHRPSDGYKFVATASDNIESLFSGTKWEMAMHWCVSGSTLFVADFNNDGKGDLLCHEPKTGRVWISYNQYSLKEDDACLENPCKTGGKCTHNNGGYSCTCVAGFEGKNCEEGIDKIKFSRASVTDYITVKRRLPQLTSLTLCLWMNALVGNQEDNKRTMISYAVPGSDNEIILINPHSLSFFIGGEKWITGISTNDGDWHHICVTWENHEGQCALYKDGVRLAQGNLNEGHVIGGGGSLIIGQEQDAVGGKFAEAESYIGEMTGINIWSNVLSPSEISAMSKHEHSTSGNILAWNDVKIDGTTHGQVEIFSSCTSETATEDNA